MTSHGKRFPEFQAEISVQDRWGRAWPCCEAEEQPCGPGGAFSTGIQQNSP